MIPSKVIINGKGEEKIELNKTFFVYLTDELNLEEEQKWSLIIRYLSLNHGSTPLSKLKYAEKIIIEDAYDKQREPMCTLALILALGLVNPDGQPILEPSFNKANMLNWAANWDAQNNVRN